MLPTYRNDLTEQSQEQVYIFLRFGMYTRSLIELSCAGNGLDFDPYTILNKYILLSQAPIYAYARNYRKSLILLQDSNGTEHKITNLKRFNTDFINDIKDFKKPILANGQQRVRF